MVKKAGSEGALFDSWSKNFKLYHYSEYNNNDARLLEKDIDVRKMASELEEYGKMIIMTFQKLSKESLLDGGEGEIFTDIKIFALLCLREIKSEGILQILDKSYEIGLKKNHDYGSANITNFGTLGLLVRLNDKVQRVKNLVGSSGVEKVKNLSGTKSIMVKDEKVEDTLLDMINYATYGNMMFRGVWF